MGFGQARTVGVRQNGRTARTLRTPFCCPLSPTQETCKNRTRSPRTDPNPEPPVLHKSHQQGSGPEPNEGSRRMRSGSVRREPPPFFKGVRETDLCCATTTREGRRPGRSGARRGAKIPEPEPAEPLRWLKTSRSGTSELKKSDLASRPPLMRSAEGHRSTLWRSHIDAELVGLGQAVEPLRDVSRAATA